MTVHRRHHRLKNPLPLFDGDGSSWKQRKRRATGRKHRGLDQKGSRQLFNSGAKKEIKIEENISYYFHGVSARGCGSYPCEKKIISKWTMDSATRTLSKLKRVKHQPESGIIHATLLCSESPRTVLIICCVICVGKA